MLFVASRESDELLVIDTAEGRQVQRIAIGDYPIAVASENSKHAVAYVANHFDHTISLIDPGHGVFAGPDGDSNRGDGLWDFEVGSGLCSDPSVPGEPDPGVDIPAIVCRPQANRILVSRLDLADQVTEVLCLHPHPVTGFWQEFAVTLPAAATPSGLKGFAKNLIFPLLEIAEVRRHRVILSGFDPNMRPVAARVETEVKYKDGSSGTETSSLTIVDENKDNVVEGYELNTDSLVSSGSVDFKIFDSSGAGTVDYASTDLPLVEKLLLGMDGDEFLPLADTNGDGAPDSPALDFDGDNLPDPEFPLLHFMSGPPHPVNNEQNLYFAQFGDGTQGATSIFSQIMLLNLDTETPAEVTVVLRDDGGNPLAVDLNGEQVAGEKEFTIAAGGLEILRTDGLGALAVGSVAVRSDRAVAGVIVFGGSAGVAGVGSSHVMTHGFVAAMERSTPFKVNTGVAVMNLESHDITVDLALRNASGTLLATSQLTLKGEGHRALFVAEIDWEPEAGVQLDFGNFRGLLTATVDARLAATVLQTRPGEFATMPVARAFTAPTLPGCSRISVSPWDGNLNQQLHFAQFGDGAAGSAQILSQVMLFNLTGRTASTRILLNDDEGKPLTVDLNGTIVTGELELLIPARGLRILKTDGQGPVTVGSATVESDQALAGVLLFAGSAGVAGVGSSSPILKGFTAPMESDSSEGINTGVAVMNLESEPVNLSVSLRDEENQILATDELELSAKGHRALFLTEFNWEVEEGVTLDFSDFTGLLRIETTGKVTATVLQTRPGVFATQPVIPDLG
jgi:hypothetical protein